MMHIPKNAELFLCEQLCTHSKLTQFSAPPPFKPWAKREPCQPKGWRKKGVSEKPTCRVFFTRLCVRVHTHANHSEQISS